MKITAFLAALVIGVALSSVAHGDQGQWRFDAKTGEAFVDFDRGGGKFIASCGQLVARANTRGMGKGMRPRRGVYLTVDDVALPNVVWQYENGEAHTLVEDGPYVEEVLSKLASGELLQVSVVPNGAPQRHYRASLHGAGAAITELRAHCAAR